MYSNASILMDFLVLDWISLIGFHNHEQMSGTNLFIVLTFFYLCTIGIYNGHLRCFHHIHHWRKKNFLNAISSWSIGNHLYHHVACFILKCLIWTFEHLNTFDRCFCFEIFVVNRELFIAIWQFSSKCHFVFRYFLMHLYAWIKYWVAALVFLNLK